MWKACARQKLTYVSLDMPLEVNFFQSRQKAIRTLFDKILLRAMTPRQLGPNGIRNCLRCIKGSRDLLSVLLRCVSSYWLGNHHICKRKLSIVVVVFSTQFILINLRFLLHLHKRLVATKMIVELLFLFVFIMIDRLILDQYLTTACATFLGPEKFIALQRLLPEGVRFVQLSDACGTNEGVPFCVDASAIPEGSFILLEWE